MVRAGDGRPRSSIRRSRIQRRRRLEETIGREALNGYESALQRLREADREAIIGRVEMSLTYDELAKLLGKPSANAARMAVERALVRLAAEIGPSSRAVPRAHCQHRRRLAMTPEQRPQD